MIKWDDINLKGRTNGSMKTTCPNCSETRKKKKDPCLSVNVTKGVARCWNCEEVSFRENVEKTEPEKEYNRPPQEWMNYTNLSDKVVKYFADRGISQNTLIACRITEEEYYQPSAQKKVNNIVFNYFDGKELVNKKYRSAKKGFTQVRDAKKIFYGINDIIGETEAYICEGEIDKLSFWEIGKVNCISVPNGASDLNDVFDTCAMQLNSIETFIIAVDMDGPGLKLEQELIKRLGKHRCKRVKFFGKDANDDLVSGRLEEAIKSATDYPIEGTFTSHDLREGVMRLFKHGLPPSIQPKGEMWKELNNGLWGVMRGQLTAITGIPSHGKSNFLEWYLINLMVDHDLKASFYSPEHLPMELHKAYLAEKVIGKPFRGATKDSERMTEDELNQYLEWSDNRIYLTAPENGKLPTWDWIFDTFRSQIFRYGIDIFVIDAFNKVRRGTDAIKEIGDILAEAALFSQYHNVMMFLVVHPTKMKKKEGMQVYEVPSLYDMKGSGDFADQIHNGATVYRYFGQDGYTQFVPQKLKFRHQGEVTGEAVEFLFNRSNGRYYPKGGAMDFRNLLIPNQPEPQKQELRNLGWQKTQYQPDDLFVEDETPAPF